MAEASTSFGHELRAAREAAGLSVRAAAKAADLSEGLWRQLELGYRQINSEVRVPTNPRPSTVRSTAETVGLDVALALDLAGYPEEADRERARSVGAAADDEPVVAHDPVPTGDDRLVTEGRLRQEIDRVRDELTETLAERLTSVIRKELGDR